MKEEGRQGKWREWRGKKKKKSSEELWQMKEEME
ncbi:hypothetical protein QG37_04205 [Candidozyma auris]|uniref:Uncharacterized protein n=1 Tax=Candidozyma auris TaxID=498019 RepID=A0A0L0NXE4_CANAR|nr:hypothetical protein QG37_04205 [[Candida] auris]